MLYDSFHTIRDGYYHTKMVRSVMYYDNYLCIIVLTKNSLLLYHCKTSISLLASYIFCEQPQEVGGLMVHLHIV